MNRVFPAALALACLVASPVLAAEVAAAPATVVSFGWGEVLSAALQAIEPGVIAVLTALVGIGVKRISPLAGLFITDKVVEGALTKWLDYGLNAVEGATKGKALNVDVGSAVLAQAVNRALDRSTLSKQGKVLLDKAGGPAEVANKLFRMLHLDESGSDAILQEVLTSLRAGGYLKA